MSGIYIHIPFCRQACTYCDFHFSTLLNNKPLIIKSIEKELQLRHSYLQDKQINSIYFGGGTPSLLTAQELGGLMAALQQHFSWTSEAEITLEANPDDINDESLKNWRSLGINRLSIGLQSFDDAELKWMNRAHNALESVSSVKRAQDHGFNNLSIDLIYGSKFQSLSSWESTLQQAIGLNTQHISSYNLTIENQTVLGLKHRRGQEPAVSDGLSSAQFLLMADLLSAAAYTQYEISNFGKAGYFAVHNSNYWLQKSYLGLGPSAHSFNGDSRQWNVKNNNTYLQALAAGTDYFERESLSLNDRYNEYVLTRLRTIWGCNLAEMELMFGTKLSEHFKKQAVQHHRHLEEKNGLVLLNKSGRLMADGIASDLFI